MAIKPIEGFYVHDEETNTDGIAKVSDRVLEGNIYSFLSFGGKLFKSLFWESGSIQDNANTEVANAARIRSNYVRIYGDVVYLYIPDGYQSYFFQFDTSKAFVRETGWHNAGWNAITLNGSTEYVRVILRNAANDSTIVPENGDGVQLSEPSFIAQHTYRVGGTDVEWHAGYVKGSDGEIGHDSSTSYKYSDLIKVPSCLYDRNVFYKAYASNIPTSVAVYDEDMEYIGHSTYGSVSGTSYQLPTGAYWVRLSTLSGTLSTDNSYIEFTIQPIDELIELLKRANSALAAEGDVWG